MPDFSSIKRVEAAHIFTLCFWSNSLVMTLIVEVPLSSTGSFHILSSLRAALAVCFLQYTVGVSVDYDLLKVRRVIPFSVMCTFSLKSSVDH